MPDSCWGNPGFAEKTPPYFRLAELKKLEGRQIRGAFFLDHPAGQGGL